MSEQITPTKLTPDQARYLTSHLDDLPEDIRWILDLGKRPFALTDVQRRLLIERVADRLQGHGFGSDYEPTGEGKLLESILDALRSGDK